MEVITFTGFILFCFLPKWDHALLICDPFCWFVKWLLTEHLLWARRYPGAALEWWTIVTEPLPSRNVYPGSTHTCHCLSEKSPHSLWWQHVLHPGEGRPLFGHSADGCFVCGGKFHKIQNLILLISLELDCYMSISLSLSLFPFLNKVNTTISMYYLKQLFFKTIFFSNRKNPNVTIAGTGSIVLSFTFFHWYPLCLLDSLCSDSQCEKNRTEGKIFTLLQDS